MRRHRKGKILLCVTLTGLLLIPAMAAAVRVPNWLYTQRIMYSIRQRARWNTLWRAVPIRWKKSEHCIGMKPAR